MIIGIISDTHIPKRSKVIPQIVLDSFSQVDHIIHAGDINDIEVINILNKIAPVTAVMGNTDSNVLNLLTKKIITVGDFRIGVFHGHGIKGKTINRVLKQFDKDQVHCIVFGHSHNPFCEIINGILIFNPGSPTDKRRNPYYSFGILEINESIRPSIIYFDKEGKIK